MSNDWIEPREFAYRPSDATEDTARELVDASFVVYRELGPGFTESIYENALAIELEQRGIPFARQPTVPVHFRGNLVGRYRLDFIVNECVIVELKAIRTEPLVLHVSQIVSYLRATRLDLGFVINFGQASFKAGIKRICLPPKKSP
jgi:GxxExxY protein